MICLLYLLQFSSLAEVENTDLIHAIRESALEAAKAQLEMEQLQKRLNSNLEKQGMTVRAKVPGDGNCFFYSVIDQLQGLS